ncbi:hypothetical protein HB780_20915 [Rhizobium lusitanum]|uniref:hypothetical protein n=1 Tax=Rhizobium lusitanum TaxID=293958 RepID=UPI00161D40EB|nr:hypothetical protein [Rhizobium lusitanum]QND48103.1 hypothetical protein HB780_20915 [Rhizobium lusitanum]
MFGLKLVQSPRGARVYPPSSNTNNLATFAPAFAEALARAASVALDGEARDRTAA